MGAVLVMLTGLIGGPADAYAELSNLQLVGRDHFVVDAYRGDYPREFFADLSDEWRLMMRVRIRSEGVVNTTDRKQADPLFVGTCRQSPLDSLSGGIRTNRVFGCAKTAGELIVREKCKSALPLVLSGVTNSGLFIRERNAGCENYKADVMREFDCRAIPNICKYERYSGAGAIATDYKAAAEAMVIAELKLGDVERHTFPVRLVECARMVWRLGFQRGV